MASNVDDLKELMVSSGWIVLDQRHGCMWVRGYGLIASVGCRNGLGFFKVVKGFFSVFLALKHEALKAGRESIPNFHFCYKKMNPTCLPLTQEIELPSI